MFLSFISILFLRMVTNQLLKPHFSVIIILIFTPFSFKLYSQIQVLMTSGLESRKSVLIGLCASSHCLLFYTLIQLNNFIMSSNI